MIRRRCCHSPRAQSAASCCPPPPSPPPPRWRTEPDLSWDTGRWVWATPFEHSVKGAGNAAGLGAGVYGMVMAMPLAGATG